MTGGGGRGGKGVIRGYSNRARILSARGANDRVGDGGVPRGKPNARPESYRIHVVIVISQKANDPPHVGTKTYLRSKFSGVFLGFFFYNPPPPVTRSVKCVLRIFIFVIFNVTRKPISTD